MLSYEEALARLLAATNRLPAIEVGLDRAAGLRAARALHASLTKPSFAASAMDGYAIRWEDRAGPWRVIGESLAGARYRGEIGPGQAVRIFTGACLPVGADTVIVQEDVECRGDELHRGDDGPPVKAAHVRPAGLDFTAGDLLVSAGTRLTPAHIGLAAAGGAAVLGVTRRPRVALLATGDELVPPGIIPGEDQIVSANGAMLVALLTGAGAEVRDLGLVGDDADRISEAVAGASDFDLLLTIGGASVGARDLVRQALGSAGAEIDFWQVAIKPGKPLIAGRLDDTRILGLPGNPVSAFVCALLFAVPIVRKMAGADRFELPVGTAPLLGALPAGGDRREHLRARVGNDGVAPLPVQDSAMLRPLAAANALIIRPPGASAASAGEMVELLRLDRVLDVP